MGAATAALAVAAGLDRRHHADRAAMVEFQERRLRAILMHAGQEVPFYRDRFAGIDLRNVRRLTDLSALPTVRKHDLRCAQPTERIAAGVRWERLARYRTSGTSGEPFEIRRTHGEDLLLGLFLWRAWRAVGVRFADRRVFIGLIKPGPPGAWARLSRWLRRRLLRRIDCLQPLERIATQVRSFHPHLLKGYPGVLSRLVPLQRQAKIAEPQLIITGGEELTPSAREEIAAAFGAPVRDIYSCYECMVMAWECDRTGLYHVNDDAVALEVIDRGRVVAEGEEGGVVVTALHSWAMPFVRYELGDRVVRGPTPCPCGSPFSTLVAIRGRRIDYYTLPDGRLVHHYALVTPALDRARARDLVGRYQLVQERADLFLLRVTADLTGGEAVALRFAAELRAILGSGVELHLEVVGRDDFAPAGKFRVGVSRVTPP